jgi:PBP1b-binding outer membrane lipoprotein LpoB
MKHVSLVLLIAILLSGCTQIVTAPIKVVGAVAETAIDVTAAGVRAVAGSDDDDEKEEK